MMATSEHPYLTGALVTGASAHVLDRVLRSPDVRRVLDNLPPWLRVEVESTMRAIRQAAADYEALPVASVEPLEATPDETPDGWLDAEQAADLLGVTRRRAQQLAAGGMGRRFGRAWRLDETAVREYGRRRTMVQ